MKKILKSKKKIIRINEDVKSYYRITINDNQGTTTTKNVYGDVELYKEIPVLISHVKDFNPKTMIVKVTLHEYTLQIIKEKI